MKAMKKVHFLSILFLVFSCILVDQNTSVKDKSAVDSSFSYKTIGDIKVPEGAKRMQESSGSFGAWLRTIALKKDNLVYLYNGSLKQNQAAQYAVLDIPVGNKDLQQCADAVMRLRAEYLFSEKRFSEIKFRDNAGKVYEWKGRSNPGAFENYLNRVFAYCGSASLEKQLIPVADFNKIKTGDVFIKGGFPGHAMLVVDIAMDEKGMKYFMLAQSYMPAQDIHIVRNPTNEALSPWYKVSDSASIITPEWKFYKNQLREW